MFGDGARHGFEWVFEGASAVEVSSVDDILDWLRGCRYETDANLFQEPDFWQHPRTFEQFKRGDCEDFALWAWRKLVELGLDASLVIGRRIPPGAENSRHAWIQFRHGETDFLFEPVLRDHDRALRPLGDVRTEYIPELGVAPDRRRFLFAGYAYFLQNRHLGRANPETSAA